MYVYIYIYTCIWFKTCLNSRSFRNLRSMASLAEGQREATDAHIKEATGLLGHLEPFF